MATQTHADFSYEQVGLDAAFMEKLASILAGFEFHPISQLYTAPWDDSGLVWRPAETWCTEASSARNARLWCPFSEGLSLHISFTDANRSNHLSVRLPVDGVIYGNYNLADRLLASRVEQLCLELFCIFPLATAACDVSATSGAFDWFRWSRGGWTPFRLSTDATARVGMPHTLDRSILVDVIDRVFAQQAYTRLPWIPLRSPKDSEWYLTREYDTRNPDLPDEMYLYYMAERSDLAHDIRHVRLVRSNRGTLLELDSPITLWRRFYCRSERRLATAFRAVLAGLHEALDAYWTVCFDTREPLPWFEVRPNEFTAAALPPEDDDDDE